MRKFLSKLVKPLGYEVIRARNSHNEKTALSAAFNLTQPDLVIDVGANNGQFYQLCRDAGYQGEIWCLEPSPVQFSNLKRLQKTDQLVKSFNLGVSSKEDTLILNVSGKIGDMSSFLEQNELYQDRFKSGATTDRVEVKVVTLEQLISNEKPDFRGRIFLKTDTQGMDKRVIQGMGEYLRRDMLKGIKSEMSVQNIYRDSASHWELLDIFKDLGMEPLFFEHISRTDDYRLLEYDLIVTK